MKSIRLAIIIVGLAFSSNMFAEHHTAQQLAIKMKVGWNLCNTLECPTGETGQCQSVIVKLQNCSTCHVLPI